MDNKPLKMKEGIKYNIPNVQTNQKALRIKKGVSNKNNLYAIFNLEYLMYALLNLSPRAFKIWCMLNKNQDGYELKLSSKDFLGMMSKQTYLKAIEELIDKKYLRAAQGKGQIYFSFYSKTQRRNERSELPRRCAATRAELV